MQERKVTLDARHARVVDENSPLLPLSEWARSKYILHLRGRAYSASLKLQMLLGSPVVGVLSKCASHLTLYWQRIAWFACNPKTAGDVQSSVTLLVTMCVEQHVEQHVGGSAVIFAQQLQICRCQEFWYPALHPGRHFVPLDMPLNFTTARPALDAIMGGPRRQAHAAKVGKLGRQFVMDELAPEALDCYWATVLVRYGKLYARLKQRDAGTQ